MFVGLHAMLAMQTRTPELMITEQEGRDFTRAAQNVMRHYSVQTTQKTLDWIALGGVTVGMYGTRVYAISARRAGERAAAGEPKGQVIRFPDRSRPPAADQAGDAAGYAPSVPAGDEGGEGF
jgi:hypothetical protein